jgi:hypothetical protein
MADHTIKVYEDPQGVWRAVEVKGHQPYSDPIVKPGETVEWLPVDTDVTINFPEPRIFLESELFVYNGQAKTLTVKSRVDDGTYPYSVFCHQESTYAQGSVGPPPIIIVTDVSL